MSDGLLGKVETRMAEIKKEFEGLDSEFKGLVAQRSQIDKRINEIQVTGNGLDKAYCELMALAGIDAKGNRIAEQKTEDKITEEKTDG